MKGLYLNAASALREAEDLQARIGAPYRVSQVRLPGGDELAILHLPEAWSDVGGPIHRLPERDLIVAASGWFMFRGAFNDLPSLTSAWAEAGDDEGRLAVLREVDAGAFVLVFAERDGVRVVTDPFGLHPHYRLGSRERFVVGPAPALLSNGLRPEPLRTAVLEKVNHLFGDLTAWREIERMAPGAVHDLERVRPWFHVPHAGDPAEALPRMRATLARVPRPWLLALSGGLDSRFVLAAGERFEMGYTFGPPNTGDRPVARRFAHKFEHYQEFSLLDVPYPSELKQAGRRLFEGVCPRPFLEVLAVHRWMHEKTAGYVFLDGYAGDVIQRGTYLTHGGIRGALAKLVPAVTLRRFDPVGLLRRRHAALDDREFELVEAVFEEKTSGWDLDGPHRVLLFEILHGRGARHSLNGGTLMSGQYFVTLQPFYFPEVFAALFAQKAEAWLRWRTLRDAWSAMPVEVASERTYSGFNPLWQPDVARAVMLATKALGHAAILRRARNYETELHRVRWY